MKQYALPCSHMIFEKLDAGEALSKDDVHPRWWLVKPLVCFSLVFPYKSY
jgi:hypothetical protein